MKSLRLCLLLLLPLPALKADDRPAFDPALEDHAWLTSVLGYAYYWYLDDSFFASIGTGEPITLWLRSVAPPHRDAGDRSAYAECWLPQGKVLLAFKRADYEIEELNLKVKSAGYRVVRGSFEERKPDITAGWKQVVLPREEVMEEFSAKRGMLNVPKPTTRTLAMAAVRREATKLGSTGPQKLYVASRTSVTTDIWVFWENERVLLRISGDMDAVDPGLVGELPLLVRRFQLGENVVASYLEAEGRNSMISRDLASRALFVCLARGEPIIIDP